MVRSSSPEWAARFVLGLCVAMFAALKVYSFGHVDSDENIYFYMAVRTSFDGVLPYRDYFFAHPPLHLYLAVAAFKLVAFVTGSAATMTNPASWADGGVALGVAKSIGVVSGAIAALFLYRAARKFGPLEAALAAACFLLAPDVLSSCFTGTMEAVMFMAIAVERVVAGRDRQAGLAFAAATLVALYAAPAGLAVFVVLLVVSPRRALTLALSTGLPLAIVHGGFMLWAGRAYFDAVFTYHFLKPPGANGIAEALAVMLRHDTPMMLALPLALGALALERRTGFRAIPLARLREDPRRQMLAFSFTAIASTLLVLAAGKAFYGFYLLSVAPFCALLAGYGYGATARAALAIARPSRAGMRSRWAAAVALAVLASIGLAGETLADSAWVRRREIPDERVGTLVTHAWNRAPRLGPIDDVVRALFFRERQSLGQRASSITRYLWNVTHQPFDFAGKAAVNVRRAVAPGGTLFGESTVVPLVALASGRRLALDEADTNDMRFRSGMTSPASFVERLRRAPPDAVIFGIGDPVLHLAPFASWLREDYDTQLVDARGILYVLHTRKGRPPLVPELPGEARESHAMEAPPR